MSKRKVYNYTRRTLAFLMAMIMTLSVVQSSSMTAFAQTGSDVVVTETEAVDVIEETSVTNTEEVSSETIVEEDEESVAEPISSEVSSETEEVSSEAVEETTEVIETTEAATIAETEEMTVEVVETVPAVDVMEDGEAYIGSEEPEGTLQIHMSMMENYSMDALLAILETRKAEETRYNEVYLGFDEIALENNTIPEELWNAVYDVLKPETEEGLRRLFVRYFPEGSSEYNEWEFRYPSKIETTLDYDLVLGKTLTLSEESNGGANISFVNTTFPCEQVNFRARIYTGETLFEQYCTAFGTSENIVLEVYDSENNRVDNGHEVYASYECRDGEAGLRVSCLGGNYEAGKNYTLKLPPYKGNYDERIEDDGYKFQNLYIQPEDVDKTSFTAEEIAEILSYYDEKSIDEITIVYRTDAMGGTVDDAVINATLPYLKDSSEGRKSCTRIAFQNTTTNEEFTWILVNPGEQIEDQTLTASFAVADGVATVSVGSQSFVAEGVNITVSRSNESDAEGVTALKTIYGETPTRLLVGDTDVPAGFDMDDWSVWIWIDDISQLTPNTTYTIGKYVYKGHIYTWDDGRKELNINFGEEGKDAAFTEQELLDILANYSTDDELYCIYIEQPSGETDTIYKKVADAAANLLPNGGEVKFAFRNQTTGTSTEWILEGIKAGVEQSEDQVVKAALTVSSNNLLEFSREAFDLTTGEEGAVSIGYSINTEEDTVITKAVFDTFGEFEGHKLIETRNGEAGGDVNYDKDNNNIWLYLNGITELYPGDNYPLTAYFYRGDVHEDFDDEGCFIGTSLYISAHELEKDTFDTASFKKIVDYWVSRGVAFSNVSIEQTFTSNNIVKKDLFNAARPLLASEESGLTFVFCRCQMAEQDENGEETKPYIQSDMNWHFQGITKNATKDINANVSVVKKGGGVSAVLKSNTYPSKHTHVQFWMSEDADMVQNVLVPAFGKAKPQSSLVVLEKAATLKTLSNGDMPASYDGNEGMVNLFLANVEEWKAGIDNRLVEAYERPEAPIGEQADVILLTYDPNDPEDPSYPPEEGDWSHPDQPKANVKFSLLTPDIATMGYRVNENGTRYDYVIPNVPWKTVYTLCTYTSVSDEACVEVLAYPTTVDISGIAFAEDVIDIEWDGSNPEHYGYLGININPRAAQNHFNPQEFTWTVTQSEESPVIELRKHPYYTWDEEQQTDVYVEDRPDGEFRVVGYGEATVTVTYKDFEPITCKVKVVEPVHVPEDIPSIFAIPAIDTKLSDLGEDLDTLIRARGINAEYEGRFDWKDSSISLAPYANMEWAEFAAIYTAPDGRQVPTTVAVEMLRITDIKLFAAEIYGYTDPETSQDIKELYIEPLNGSSVVKGDELVMGYQVDINREKVDGEGNMTPEFLAFARYIEEGKLSINWKEKDILTSIDPVGEKPYDMTIDENVYNNGQIQKPSKYVSTAKGKKTFTVEAVNELTQKPIFNSSATVIVTGKPVFAFDDVEIEGLDEKEAMKGDFLIKVDAEDYADAKKLTIKSADTSTLKLGSIKVNPADKTTSGKVEITVPYEFKKYGKTVLKITAADEVKTSESFAVERVDYAPKIPVTSYAIDKSWMFGSGETAVCRATDIIDIAYRDDITLTGEVTIKEEAYQDVFKLVSDGDGYYWIQVEKADLADLKNKTYTLTLKIPYTINGDETGNVEPCEQKIKVKVMQSKIKVTAKQTQKINEFYKLTSAESNGIITLKTPYALMECTLNKDSVFDLVVNDTNGYNEFTYALVLKDDYRDIEKLTDAQKKITLNYKLYNGMAEHNGFVNLTLKTENKKPSLVLPKKSDTLYPGMDVGGSVFVVMNKSTGEPMDLTGNVSLVLDKRKNITQAIVSGEDPAAHDFVKVGKNNYCINANGVELNYWLYDSANAVKSTDKFIIRVQKENWNKPVDLTYSTKVDLKTPKLKLDSKTLTINANDDVYRYQTAATHINLTGYAGTQFDEIWISGVKDADKNALKNNLTFVYNREESKLHISIDDKGALNEEAGIDTRLKTGNYKFKVWTMLNGKKLSTDITIKIVDKAPAKSVKVTKKGSLDVLRRGMTQITMNPKFTNLSGDVVDFRLTGPDAELFDYYYDWETGNCVVKARLGVNYSTKITYNVTPVYRLADNGDYTVEGKAQKIKVTQGKPKVSILTNTNTLYGDKSNEVFFSFDAMLKNEYIFISDVQLLNYTNDLDWEWDWEADKGTLSLNGNTPKDITKASGKYTLKFAVTYTDGAGNEKATQVSYKLNIVR